MVLDVKEDDELGIDGEGLGDAVPGDEDDEVEASVVVTPDVENVGGRGKVSIGAVELLDAEEYIDQLRVFNTAHNLPSGVAIHIDRYAHSLRRFQTGSKKFNPTFSTYYELT